MKHGIDDVQIVQLGAPHGVLDLGNTMRLYEEVARTELDPSAENILLYEAAGGYTRDQAESISRDIATRRSVIDAEMARAIRKNGGDIRELQRTIDGRALQVLLFPPLTEHVNHFINHFFIDWLLRREAGVPLVVFPESCRDEGQKQRILTSSREITTPVSVEGPESLDSILATLRGKDVMLEGNIAERDAEIGLFLEQKVLLSVSRQTRTRILVLIGSGHTKIQSGISGPVNYRTRIFGSPVEGPDINEECKRVDYNREQTARILCARIISGQMKRIFLDIYQNTLLKEPGRNAEGQTVFDYSLQVCQSVPIDAIYLFLQKIANIDCGLTDGNRGQGVTPALLAPQPELFIRTLEDLVERWGVNDLSESELGTFVARTFVSKFLLYAFDIPDNPRLRTMVADLVANLREEQVQMFKAELELYLKSSGSFPPEQFINIVLGMIIKNPRLRPLMEDLMRRGIIVNVGGYAHLRLRIWE